VTTVSWSCPPTSTVFVPAGASALLQHLTVLRDGVDAGGLGVLGKDYELALESCRLNAGVTSRSDEAIGIMLLGNSRFVLNKAVVDGWSTGIHASEQAELQIDGASVRDNRRRSPV
jgi:hypothetical protein